MSSGATGRENSEDRGGGLPEEAETELVGSTRRTKLLIIVSICVPREDDNEEWYWRLRSDKMVRLVKFLQ